MNKFAKKNEQSIYWERGGEREGGEREMESECEEDNKLPLNQTAEYVSMN